MSRVRSFARLMMPLALLSVAACATPFKAKVNRFQAMPAPSGQSFIIKPADPKREGSLEFAQYATLVSQKMTQIGYQLAPSPDAASLIVTLDYNVDGGREKIRSAPTAGFGFSRFGYGPFGYSGFGYGRSRFAYGFYDPFLFGSGYNDIESYTVYNSGIRVDIARKADGQRVFEGKADAMSLNNSLTYLVPNLVEAMFTGFPGNSGETVRITVPPPAKR